MASLREHGPDDQHEAYDQPRNGIEVLIASARDRRMPASGTRSIALYVRDENRQEPRSCKQSER